MLGHTNPFLLAYLSILTSMIRRMHAVDIILLVYNFATLLIRLLNPVRKNRKVKVNG
jgi:hypothetical protein